MAQLLQMLNCSCRYTVKELLIHDFFMPEELIGLRVEIKNKDGELTGINNEVGG